mmetsp:Transcript_115388/g.230088  ORF Transcript_115388/g.230088 Transcript_115388/m.230088 type:complete len:506 (-) Transcript_115388:332-1849(-)|eukprot:CAMPEP_0172675940 /NCGR_PEP_ID=MMETSP1074-20121228/13604_1 /TAXON_ID=2916 /ORGANISM="Ceratium fusus, Strain PA161109" /LENGTH=505 /DNA_ID=CAMNT_0013493481 /DNA_START=93 /DNA_END=1610 /DNA_ORIENTATION=-
MEHVDDDGLHVEFAEEDIDGDGASRWNRPSPGVPAPFEAVQYPLMHFGHGAPLAGRESTVNLLVNLLGVGILTAPRALARAGLATGLVVLACVAAASCQTLLALVKHNSCHTHRGSSSSFPEIGRHALGPQGLGVVLLAYLLYGGGLFTAYVVTLVDVIQQLTAAHLPRLVHVLLALAMCTPTLMMRNLRYATVLSAMCAVSMTLLVATLFTNFVGEAGTSDADEETVDLNFASVAPGGLLAAASLFAVQFSAHAGFLEVLGEAGCHEEGVELESRTNIDQGRQALSSLAAPKTGMNVAGGPRGAFVMAAMLVGSVATAGYMRFGNSVAGNVLSSFATKPGGGYQVGPLLLAQIAYGFALAYSAGFIAAPCRAAMLELFAVRRGMGGTSVRAFRVASGVLLFACGLAAWLQQDVANVLCFVGSFAAGPMVFALPSLIALEPVWSQEGRLEPSVANAQHVALLVLGALLPLGFLGEAAATVLSRSAGYSGHRIMVHDFSNITTRTA